MMLFMVAIQRIAIVENFFCNFVYDLDSLCVLS